MKPKFQVESWPVEKLRPYEHNPRKNDHVVNKMADALREFGFRVPILAKSDGELIDGHLRYKAALVMGLDFVPVIRVDDLDENRIRAFRILINRSAAWADWDEEELLNELRALQAAEFDLSATGFDDRELDKLLAEINADEKDPDDVPDAPAAPVSKRGDVWILGRHRLMCGDATNPDDARRLMDGRVADMVWTDPPYNVNYQGKAGKIKNDKMAGGAFYKFLLASFTVARDCLRSGGAIYVAHADVEGFAFRRAFQDAEFRLAACLIWRKNHITFGRLDYHYQHEPILYGWKRGAVHRFYGDRKQRSFFEAGLPDLNENDDGSWSLSLGDRVFRVRGEALSIEEIPTTVISAPKPNKSVLHPTMKPVALIEKMIANSSPRGGLVADFFGGSGSTLMACERLGRSAALMELDPKFVDAIIRRWREYSGSDASREADGAVYSSLAQN